MDMEKLRLPGGEARQSAPDWDSQGQSQKSLSLNLRPGLDVPQEHKGNRCPPTLLGDQVDWGWSNESQEIAMVVSAKKPC